MNISIFFSHLRDISINTNKSIISVLKSAKSMGIDYVDISFDEINTNIINALNEADIKISCINKFYDLTNNANQRYDFSLIDMAKEYDSLAMIIPGFANENENISECRKLLINAMKPIANYAQNQGVQLCMEDFDSKNSPFLTSDDLIEFFKAIPNLKCAFDTGNFYYANEDVFKAYEKLKTYIIHMHCKDRSKTAYENNQEGILSISNERIFDCATGSGDLPIKQIIADLLKGDYYGSFTIEFFGINDKLSAMKNSISFLRKII